MKSRLICETKLEGCYDEFRRERHYDARSVRTQNLISMYYA